jgi:glutamate synthase (NADPH/NADH) large chain
MEPWDGPAAMAFTDGRQIGATLDRNGLRPARFIVTDDDHVVMASEVGVLDIPERKIVRKWRLQPGKMLLVDTVAGRIVDDEELKRTLAAAKHIASGSALPHRARQPARSGAADSNGGRAPRPAAGVRLHQEDLKVILAPMAANGEEAVGSMGNDAALPVLSDRPKSSTATSLFAQVTNPPIDPIREDS